MVPNNITYEITQSYILDQCVDKALRDRLLGYNRARDLGRLSTCSKLYDPHCHGIGEWRVLRQVEALFKKNRTFANRATLREASLQAFHESEKRCADTNRRLTDIALDSLQFNAYEREASYQAKRYIRNVLGSFNTFQSSLTKLIKVSSGATSTRSRRKALPQLKLSMEPYCSSRAVEPLSSVYEAFGFERPKIRTCDSNRIELVPKDWRKDRTIACEPEGSMALQLAFDGWAKRRLRRFGQDLRDQTRNQHLAKIASIENHMVTVDFSSASDTISYSTVAWLFPSEWFYFLDQVRSSHYRGVFGTGMYNKFSSMGNGSTFCIETLIFSSLCYAVGSRDHSVYGDDVIIRRKFFEPFLHMCKLFGFVVNREKTFSHGPIRESCGKEYFLGCDVTPVYIRNIDKRKAVQCHLINTLGRLTSPYENLGRLLVRECVNQKLPFVPYNESSLSGIWIDPNLARRKHVLVTRHGISTTKAYTAEMRYRLFRGVRGYYLWFLNKNLQVRFSGPWDSDTYLECTQTSRDRKSVV